MRHIIPGTNQAIYVLTKDQDEFDCDVDALEDMLDKIEEQVNITRASLEIIKANKNEIINSNGPTQAT